MERLNVIFKNRRGAVRLPWLLALAAGLYAISQTGAAIVYWLGYNGLMSAWGVTGTNILRAPAAVQWFYRFSAVLLTLIQCGLLMLSVRALNALSSQRIKRSARGLGQGMLLGTVGMVIGWGLLLLLGSVRLGWRLSRPAFSINTFALLLTSSAQALAEGAFFCGALWPLIRGRVNCWLAAPVMALVGAGAALMGGATVPMALINGGLVTLLCALLTREGNIAPAAGFLLMWRYMDRGILGFAGSTAALYESYPVNAYWLCGGNAGINASVMAMALLLMMIFLLLQRQGWFRRK